MMNVTMIARTASIVKEYTNETRQGRNGQFQSKQIMFSMACDRKYRTTSVVDGQQTQDNPTDFWLVKFVGGAADAMQKYATGKKADGKLVSRFLYMEGTFETYRSTKPVKGVMKGVNLGNGQLYDIPGMLTPDGDGLTQTIFVVDYFKFLDPNGNNANGQNGGYNQNGYVQQGTPIPAGAAPVAAAPVQQMTQPQTAAPVYQQAAPVAAAPVAAAPVAGIPAPVAPVAAAPANPAPVAQPAAATQPDFSSMMAGVAQQMAAQQAQAAAPAAPTVPTGYQPTSGSAPF